VRTLDTRSSVVCALMSETSLMQEQYNTMASCFTLLAVVVTELYIGA
jgi:hypothetical protein